MRSKLEEYQNRMYEISKSGDYNSQRDKIEQLKQEMIAAIDTVLEQKETSNLNEETTLLTNEQGTYSGQRVKPFWEQSTTIHNQDNNDNEEESCCSCTIL